MCKIVFYLYCIFRTYRFTFFASDAGIFAFFTGNSALFGVAAHDSNTADLRDYFYYVFRTGRYTHSASDTKLIIDMGNAVKNADCV